MSAPFELLLFHRDTAASQAHFDAGLDGVILDLEHRGKAARQTGYDTEINAHTLSDLRAARKALTGHILCRISGPSPTSDELRAVLDAGADEIIVPMLTSLAQAERICSLVDGAADITLMCETLEATKILPRLSRLPIRRLYVGLTDLWIARGTASIFAPLEDGLIDEIRLDVTGPSFGFGGLTLPGLGKPLCVSHLYHEMARLNAGFTFLRRSYYRDAKDLTPTAALQAIRADMQTARARSRPMVAAHYARSCRAVASIGESAHAF